MEQTGEQRCCLTCAFHPLGCRCKHGDKPNTVNANGASTDNQALNNVLNDRKSERRVKDEIRVIRKAVQRILEHSDEKQRVEGLIALESITENAVKTHASGYGKEEAISGR